MLIDQPNKRYAVIPSKAKYCRADMVCMYNEAFAEYIGSKGSFKMVKVAGYDPIYISNDPNGLKDGVYIIIQEVLMYRG